MRLLIDACLSPAVATALREAGHDALHLADLKLEQSTDEVILARARVEERALASADADFGSLLAGSGADGPSVVMLRSSEDLTPGQQAALLIANLPQVAEDLERGAVVVIGRRRLRVRNLPFERSQ